MELGLLIIKPPQAGKIEPTQKIYQFVQERLIENFGKNKTAKIFDRLTDNGEKIAKKIYSDIAWWEGFEEMINYFTKDKFMHPFVFYGPDKISDFMKSITGKTRGEYDPKTIRGMMFHIYGCQKERYMNFVHVSDPKKVKEELIILKENKAISDSYMDWDIPDTREDLKEILIKYNLIKIK